MRGTTVIADLPAKGSYLGPWTAVSAAYDYASSWSVPTTQQVHTYAGSHALSRQACSVAGDDEKVGLVS